MSIDHGPRPLRITLTALVVVRFLLDFVSKHGFGPFAWWRIVVGVVGLALLQAGF